MTIHDALQSSGLPRLEAEALLSALLERDPTWLLAHSRDRLPPSAADLWPHLIARARAGEPVAYLVGRETFLGRTYVVDPRVLIPRACTERLCELARSVLAGETVSDCTVEIDLHVVAIYRRFAEVTPTRVVEIGTGSGCLAVSLALSGIPQSVIATDISQDALDLAELNVARHKVSKRVELRHGDCLDPVLGLKEPFLIVSNPPYVPDHFTFQRSVHAYEPVLALRGGGVGGTDILQRIVEQAKIHPACTGLVLECRDDQVMEIDKLLVLTK